MSASIEIYVDQMIANEVAEFFRAQGIRTSVWQMNPFGQMNPAILKLAAGAVVAITHVVVAYIKAKPRSRRLVVEVDGRKIAIDAASPDEVGKLLIEAKRVFIKKKKRKTKRHDKAA